MKEYKVKKFSAINDIKWDIVDVANIDVFKWTDNYKPKTIAQAVWVECYGLIVKMTSFETNPYTKCVEDGQDVHEDSCLEFFISFDNKNYLNIEANSNAIKKIGFGSDRHNRKKVWLTHPGYFQVSSFKEKDKWGLIDVLPFSGIKELFPNFDSNKIDTVVANFYHMGTNPNGEGYYYSMWNEINTKDPDFHQLKDFGRLVF